MSFRRFVCHATLSSIIGLSILSITLQGQELGTSSARSDASTWPQWRGPNRDGISDEKGLLRSWPADGPTLLWSVAGIGRGYSSPIIANATLFITGDEEEHLVIRAFALDGKLKWQAKNGAAWHRSYPGARSSCTYSEGKLYQMNAHGRLACLDAGTGRELWAVNVLERAAAKNITWGISEAPLILGDVVYAVPCGAEALVVAFDKHSGDVIWESPPIAEEQPNYASPIIVEVDDRKLLVYSATNHVFAVDAMTGKLCWKLPQEDPKNTVSSIPVWADDQLIFTNASRGNGVVFGVRFTASRAEKVWAKRLTVSHGSTVCVNGQVYGGSGRGDVRGWVAVDASTGATDQVADLKIGSSIYADDRFYCLTEDGLMTLQELTPSGFKTAGSFRLAKGKDVWAHPVICGGHLFLRYHDSLFCYELRP